MFAWRIVVYLLLPYAIGNLVWRALRYPAYWHRWPERFGFVARLARPHAVGARRVGRRGALGGAAGRRARRALSRASRRGDDDDADGVGAGARAVRRPRRAIATCRTISRTPCAASSTRVKPEVAVIAETEFWPNIFAECGRRAHSAAARERPRVAGVAARLPARAEHRARDARATPICCARRRASTRSGCATSARPQQLVHVTGNLKFDVELPASLLERGARAARRIGATSGPCGSRPARTRGEERKVLDAYAQLAPRFPELLLVLVPRHPERFRAVARLCRRRGFAVALRSAHAGRVAAGHAGARRRHDGRAAAAVRGRRRRVHRRQPRAARRPEPARSVRRARARRVRPAHVPLRRDQCDGARARRGAPSARRARSSPPRVALYFEQPELRRAAGDAAYTLVTDNRGALARTLELVEAALRSVNLAPRSPSTRASAVVAAAAARLAASRDATSCDGARAPRIWYRAAPAGRRPALSSTRGRWRKLLGTLR